MTLRRTTLALIAVLAVGSLLPVGAAGLATGAATASALSSQPTASLDYEGDAVTLYPQSDQVVSGTTSLEAGRNVSVRLQSSGSSPFLRSAGTTVAEDGSFEVTFDLSGVEPPANATASVHAGDEELASAPVEVVAEPTDTATTLVDTTDAGPTESPGQPGFTAGLALVGLAGGLLLGRR